MKPPLITTDTDGWGCAARLRGRPSSLKGRCAIALRATALRAALDPGASTAPEAGTCGQAMGLPRPGAAHVPTSQVSTVSGDCQSILIIVWHLLADDQATFTDLGPGHYDTRAGTQRAIRNHIRGLHALGYQVTLHPAA